VQEKVLITGTNGFIGKNLLNEFEQHYKVLEIQEDIFDCNDWVNELNAIITLYKPTIVFHVGACANTLETRVNYIMTRNYLFTKILCDWCKSYNAKIIYSSSAAVYGTDGVHPNNLYAWSKYVAEDYVINRGGISLRYFNAYGSDESHKGQMASIAYQMLQNEKEGKEIKIFPNKPKRDFIYIKDIVSANKFATDNYNVLWGNWYDVGYGEARTFEDVLDFLKIQYSYHDTSKIPEGYQFLTQSNKSKWMRGWYPKYNLESGLIDYLKTIII